MRSRLLATAAAVSAAAALTTFVVGAASPANAATCNGYVGLTFDDGPGNNTGNLLNALRQNGLRATMFNEGQYAAQYPAQVRAQVSAGMWVGNHSYTHPHLTQQSQAQIDSEVSRTQQAIANAGGGTPKLFRPPYGETNSTVQSVLSRYGLTQIIWDVDSQDWNNASVDAIVQANARLTNGQIILMHDWPANTVAAIPRIAQGLAARNLCAGMISPQTGRAVAPDGTNPTTPPPTTPGGGTSQPPSSPPPAGGACSATYAVTSSWQGGFQGSVTVSAGNAAISRWTVKWTFANGQTINQLWNGTLSTSGSAITVTNVSYNGTVPAGGTTSFGFTGTWNGTNAVPALTCTV
ncbi:polysaccharide deacetylase family protein [Dactylosporangium sp. NBC_01737]|uniref:polysaccharide deacetylase family protein n=1 Tax=Dactylosporangium sp. NBC_01737 TaxID=2975959 RepID=UPI002E0D3ABC|nr:polysaccharide deacetylase family protein [Dactylosporangium sp. NBC_01737]